MAEIRIPPVLRPEAGGNRALTLEAGTVREALDGLVDLYPALANRIFDGDGIPPFLNVFVDGSDVRLADGLATPVAGGSTILLLPAVAGGCYVPVHGPRDDVEAFPFGHRLRATRLAGPPRLTG